MKRKFRVVDAPTFRVDMSVGTTAETVITVRIPSYSEFAVWFVKVIEF